MSTAATSKRGPVSIHQLKVTLKGIRPPIWRRIQVPSNVTLEQLAEILQATMGWYGGHLHAFIVYGVAYGDRELVEDIGAESELTARLKAVAPSKGRRFLYQYDFGDDWEHDILVEAVRPSEPGVDYPICLTGRRACPPEDCGGPWGYAEYLDAIANPEYKEHDTLLEWLGDSFDPTHFDLDLVNWRLAVLR